MTQALKPAHVPAALARLAPGEVLVSESLAGGDATADLFADWHDRLTVEPASRFDSENAHRRLLDLYKVETLDGFGAFSRAEIAAAGALIGYVELTQKGRLPRIASPRQVAPGAIMEIDADGLEVDRGLAELGLDSLMAVEFVEQVGALFGVELPVPKLPNPFGGGNDAKKEKPPMPSMPSLPNPFGGLMDGIKKGIDQLDDIVDLKDDTQKKRRR